MFKSELLDSFGGGSSGFSLVIFFPYWCGVIEPHLLQKADIRALHLPSLLSASTWSNILLS